MSQETTKIETKMTDAEVRFINLIVTLYQTAPTPAAFYRLAKIALEENKISLDVKGE